MQARAEKIVLRGSKYGLISPVKLNTSAIFRAGSFGNHRDMLEQRQLTRTFDGTTPSEAPVQVSFLKRKEKTVGFLVHLILWISAGHQDHDAHGHQDPDENPNG